MGISVSGQTEAHLELSNLQSYLALLLSSTVMLAAAFPYLGWWPLAHVGLVPAVWLAIHARFCWRLAWTTYLMSFLWWLFMLRWLIPVTGGGYAGLAAYLALYLVAVLLLIRWLYRRTRLPLMWLVPVLWVLLELVRGKVLSGGFGWYVLAHSQAPWHEEQLPGRLIQCADLFGEQGVSFLVAMTNGLLVDLLKLGFMHRYSNQVGREMNLSVVRGEGQPIGACSAARFNAVRMLLLWLAVYAAAHVYGYYRLLESDNNSESIRIAVIQTNIKQDNKERLTKESELAIWDQIERLMRLVAQSERSADLIVWPESATPAHVNAEAVQMFRAESQRWARISHEKLTESPKADVYQSMANEMGVDLAYLPARQSERYDRWSNYADKVEHLVREVGIPLVVGSLTSTYVEPVRRYNSAYFYHSNGMQSPSRYDKCHLVPFGEYIPWVEQWPWLKDQFIKYLTPYDFDYTIDPGSDLTVFKLQMAHRVNGVKHAHQATIHFTTPICFEDTDPRIIRRMIYIDGRKRTQLLVNISNDGWFAGSVQGYQHMQAASLRCVENRVPMARSVNTGPSGFIDAVGRIGPLVSVGGRQQLVEGILAHDVRLSNRQSLFGLWGHPPLIVSLIGILALTIIRTMFRRDTCKQQLG